MKQAPIDLVITWVDGSDPEWLLERSKYLDPNRQRRASVDGDERYLDNGLLRYLFRSVEQNLVWVRKVFFVTWGHLPKWLNQKHPKLEIVNHQDFIPSAYLPTFNSATINLNLHRIRGLSNRFIYSNDDMYFLKPLKPTDFFVNGLPCDMAAQEIIDFASFQDVYYYNVVNDMTLLNSLFSKKKVIKKHFVKWLNPKYGLRHLVKGFCLAPFNLFTGIFEPHTPAPYLKESYEALWNLIPNELSGACSSKFRSPFNCTENLMRYYQMCRGDFYPKNRERAGAYCIMSQKNLPDLIRKQQKAMLCINYSDQNSFQNVKAAFEALFPKESEFEAH